MTHEARGLRWLYMMGLIGAICLVTASGGSLAWGQAYVANSGDGTVSVIDTTSNTVSGSPIMVGGEPYRVAVTPNGQFVYVTNTTGSVSVIDVLATPPAVIKAISLAGSGRGVAITGNGQFAYVVGGQTLHKIDILNNHTLLPSSLFISGSSPNGPEGVAVTPNGSFAYVVDKTSNRRSLFIVDAVSMTQVNVTILDIHGQPETFPGDDIPGPTIGGSFPLDVVARPDSQFVYVSAFSDGAVQAVRVSNHQRVGGWFAGTGPVGVAASGVGGLGNGQSVYAANSNSNSATFTTVNDTSGLPPAPPQTFTVGDGPTNNNSPQYLAVTPNGQILYVTNKLKHAVEVFNLTSSPPAKITTIPVGSTPLGIAVSPLASGPPSPPPPPPPSPPALSASLGASPVTVTVGQSITVTMTVSNTGGSAASNVAPSLLTASGTGGVSLTSGPSPASATINPGGSQPFTFTYSASVAGSVTFSGSASGGGVSSALATSNAVTIQSVSVPPTLSVAPGSLGFTGEQGLADPPAQSAQISNSGGGTLGWSITPSTTSGGNWLSANPGTGSAPPTASTSVAASTCGLPAGSYTGSTVVSAAGANGTPQAIPVTLTVTQPVTPLPSPGARVCTDRPSYRTGDTLRLSVSLRQGTSSNTGDAYLFAQVPGTTSFVSLVSSGGLIVPQLGPAPIPLGTNFQVQNFAGQVFERTLDGSEPAGTYDIKAILAMPGTNPTIPANQLGAGVASFTFAP